MRRIFTLYCFCLLFSFNDTLKAQDKDDNCPCNTPYICGMVRGYIQKNDSTSILLKKRSSSHTNCEPIYMVDGLVFKDWKTVVVDPDNIESIKILRAAEAAALFGCEGMCHGAIIIKTKGSNFRKFIIKDFLDGNRIAGATLLITAVKNRNEKFQFVANDSGVVITDKLAKSVNYIITVSAVGYQTLEQVFEYSNNTTKEEILIAREIKNCDEVILTSTYCPRSRGTSICYRWFCCGVSGIRITIDSVEKEKIYPAPAKLKIYPNPVQKGAILNFQFENNDDKEKVVRVISLDGRILLQQLCTTSGGKNVFQLPTDPRWSAGIYFVQLLYENGRVAASEKIILQ